MLNLSHQNQRGQMKDKKQDTSPYCWSRSKIKFDLRIKDLPFTPKQLEFIRLALDKNTKMIICNGPAGSSKSILSVYCSLKLMNEKRISDIIYIRSTVQPKDGETGFLQGSLEEKMQYHNVPLNDKLLELLGAEQVKALHNDNRIIAIPTSLIRGADWAAKSIIADECQNMMFSTLVTVSTRPAKFSKLFLLGDSQQNDLNGKSGFDRFFNLFNEEEDKLNGIFTFKFGTEDILRSELVRYIVAKLEKERQSEPMFAKKSS